jgi:hypothetical protein
MFIDKNSLLGSIFRQSKDFLLEKLNGFAQEKFERAKAHLLHDIENHPVSKEISAGQSVTSSKFLSGPGNLFSFLGFYEGSDPIGELIDLLDEIIVFEPSTKILDRKNLSFSAVSRTYLPTDSDLQILPLAWEPGISWASSIEKGVSNLGFYLFVNSSKSRSGKGIQVGHITRQTTFNQTPYLTPLFEKFRKDLL